MNPLIQLYKPISPSQLAVIIASGWRQFTPDTPAQKIFYPKLNIHYAEKIARQWDAPQYSAGYVVRFTMPLAFMGRYDIQTVGYDEHREYKVPIAELDLLNRHIEGRIEVVSAFTGGSKSMADQSLCLSLIHI